MLYDKTYVKTEHEHHVEKESMVSRIEETDLSHISVYI